jgi:DnaJ-class molecular chaperone
MPTHYEILGVSNDSNETDIKKAYRKLSLQYHPDRNPSEEAKQKIQEINQAYETLGDSGARQQYDHELQFGGGMGGGGGGGMGGHPFNHMNEFNDINNIFNMMFGGGGGGGFPGMGPMGGMGGGGFPGMGGPNIRIFHNGVQVNPQMFVQRPEPLNKTVNIDLETAYSGIKMPLEIERFIVKNGIQSSELETIYVEIPPGIDNNETIQLSDKGHIVNDVKGDIRLSVQIANNTNFQRNGLDITYRKKVSLKESLCGFSFEIHHLNGKRLCLNNINSPTVIKPNFKKVVQNMGMLRDGSTGNMIIEFDVEFPDVLTTEQITSLLTIL